MKHSAALSLVCALLPFTVPIPILQAPSGATTVITSCVFKLSGVPDRRHAHRHGRGAHGVSLTKAEPEIGGPRPICD